MYFSISNVIYDDKIYYRIEWIDGSTMLFSDYEECIAFCNDNRYRFITDK